MFLHESELIFCKEKYFSSTKPISSDVWTHLPLQWNYFQSQTFKDVIAYLYELYKEDWDEVLFRQEKASSYKELSMS